MATQLVAERPRVKSQGIYLRGVGDQRGGEHVAGAIAW